jgi:type VI secretion system protein ImpG
MQDDLLLYYERELAYLRRMGAQFAERYPKVASRLLLEPSKCEDPHVERLLEGFAFLAARVHHRIDDDIPELSEAFLEVLYPQHVRPVPAISIAELHLDPMQGAIPGGFSVSRGSELRTPPVQGVPCRFRTAYDTTLWPINIAAVRWTATDGTAGPRSGDAVGAVRMNLTAFEGLRLEECGLDRVRLHVAGDAVVSDTLYELLLNSCLRVVVRDPDQPSRPAVELPRDAIRAVGFDEDQGLLPYPGRTFVGHRLLQELFVFPQKFAFVDVLGLGDAMRALGAGARAEVSFLIRPFERAERRQILETSLSAANLRLGCTPVVNLFEQTCEPILLSERTYEYPIVAETRRRLEVNVWSVERIALIKPGAERPTPMSPLYGFRHGGSRGDGQLFWHAVRRPSGWRTDGGTDVFLSFADLSGNMRVPDAEVVSATALCSNGDIPARLAFGSDDRSDFELTAGGPIKRIACLVRPTPQVQPALGKPLLWRLISAMSLNHLSLVDEGVSALRELLTLHNTANALSAERQINGLLAVQSTPAFARVASAHGVAFAHGRRVQLEFDEEQFPGGGLYLLASVLERFLGLYASMNSFTQLVATSRQRRRPVREWEPRAGWKTLV